MYDFFIEPYIHAVTMEAVLKAQENGASQVAAACRLIFDQEAAAYRVERVAAHGSCKNANTLHVGSNT
jgi:hypothetical protein